jgi:hypothetical protein
MSVINYAIYHDRYQRTGNGWQFTERAYEVGYLQLIMASFQCLALPCDD